MSVLASPRFILLAPYHEKPNAAIQMLHKSEAIGQSFAIACSVVPLVFIVSVFYAVENINTAGF
jgi:hypothetical protein